MQENPLERAGITGPSDLLSLGTMESKDTKPRLKLKRLLENPEVQSWLSLMDAFRNVYRRLEMALTAEDCSVPRFQILFKLYFDGGLSPIELSKRLLVTRGNISTFLRRLQADGLIREEKKRNSDKRPAYVLTSKGRKLFESTFPRHIARVCHLMPAFGDSQIAILKRIAVEAKTKALDS